MISPVWSVVLAVAGLVTMWLAGNDRPSAWPWIVGLVSQAGWFYYAVATGQWGFVASAGAYATVHTRNLVLCRRARRAGEQAG